MRKPYKMPTQSRDEPHPYVAHGVQTGFVVASYADRKPDIGSYRETV